MDDCVKNGIVIGVFANLLILKILVVAIVFCAPQQASDVTQYRGVSTVEVLKNPSDTMREYTWMWKPVAT